MDRRISDNDKSLHWTYGSGELLFVWFEFYVPVNSYGHVEMASSPNHTVFLG